MLNGRSVTLHKNYTSPREHEEYDGKVKSINHKSAPPTDIKIKTKEQKKKEKNRNDAMRRRYSQAFKKFLLNLCKMTN